MVTITNKTIGVRTRVELPHWGVLSLGTEIYNDYAGADPFLNVAMCDSAFREYLPAIGDVIPFADTTDGWPTSVPSGAIGVMLWLEGMATSKWVKYLVQWTSDTDLTVSTTGGCTLNAGPTYDADTNTGTLEFTVTGAGAGLIWQRPTLDAGPIDLSGVEIIRDKTDAASGLTYKQLYDSGKTWDPEYVSYYRTLNPPTIRFMNQCDTNNNVTTEPALSGWTTRASGPWGRGNGDSNNRVPFSVMCELCNELSSNIWITFPIASSATFIQEVTTEIKNNLNANLQAIFEMGNEVWNAIFDQTTYAVQQGCSWANANKALDSFTGISVSSGSDQLTMASTTDATDLEDRHNLETDQTSVKIGTQYFKISSRSGAVLTLDATVDAGNAGETTCQLYIVGVGEWAGVTITATGGAGGEGTIQFATTADAIAAEDAWNLGYVNSKFVVGKWELDFSSRSGDTITLSAAMNAEAEAETVAYLGAAYIWYHQDYYAYKAAFMRTNVKLSWDSPRAATYYGDKIGGLSRRYTAPLLELIDQANYVRPLDLHELGGPAFYYGAEIDTNYPAILTKWQSGDETGAVQDFHDAIMSETPVGSAQSVPNRITVATSHLATWKANRSVDGARFIPYEGQEHWNVSSDWADIIFAYRADVDKMAELHDLVFNNYFTLSEGPSMCLAVIGNVDRDKYTWYLVDNQSPDTKDAYGDQYFNYAATYPKWW